MIFAKYSRKFLVHFDIFCVLFFYPTPPLSNMDLFCIFYGVFRNLLDEEFPLSPLLIDPLFHAPSSLHAEPRVPSLPSSSSPYKLLIPILHRHGLLRHQGEQTGVVPSSQLSKLLVRTIYPLLVVYKQVEVLL